MSVENIISGRRRHCSEMIGNSFVVFGGFNGQYHNDINFMSLRTPSTQIEKPTIIRKLLSLVNNKEFSDIEITLQTGKTIYLHR